MARETTSMSLSDQLFIATSTCGVRVFPATSAFRAPRRLRLGRRSRMHEGEVPEGWAPVTGAVRFEEKTVEVQT
ncbi:hypothetical protein OPAG_00815 [Rhodococcus opacus PD630]|nr:hypothetical protein OPAG_00815 [Rhodococcus opacus PD630]